MKKICFSCVVTLCTMLLVVSSSCSKDNSLKRPEEKIGSSELVQTLESVNNDFMANKQEVRGKGWKNFHYRTINRTLKGRERVNLLESFCCRL